MARLARRSRRGGLGASDSDHAAVGRRHIDDAWMNLERMPPTCEGGIQVASRALASAERGLAHLHAIEGEGTRAGNNESFGLGNRATHAAGQTLDFFSRVCKAPYGESREVPLFSRSKVAAEEARAKIIAARRKRRG